MKINLSNLEIVETLKLYSVTVTPAICEAIRLDISLLLHWTKMVSLTTITSPLDILRFHFGECMFAASCIPMHQGRLADVGSGAGFPGIPIKLISPDLELVLIESNGKKTAFLAEIIRDLFLQKVEVARVRMEDFIVSKSGVFDFITARALGKYEEFLSWAREHLHENGHVLLWLGKEDTEKVYHFSDWNWNEPAKIPGSDKRFLLIGTPR